jgi:hypothetical protein
MLFSVVPLCSDPISNVRRALYEGLDSRPSRLSSVVAKRHPEERDRKHNIDSFETKAAKRERNTKQHDDANTAAVDESSSSSDDDVDDIDEIEIGPSYIWKEAKRSAGNLQRVVPLRERERKVQKQLDDQAKKEKEGK